MAKHTDSKPTDKKKHKSGQSKKMQSLEARVAPLAGGGIAKALFTTEAPQTYANTTKYEVLRAPEEVKEMRLVDTRSTDTSLAYTESKLNAQQETGAQYHAGENRQFIGKKLSATQAEGTASPKYHGQTHGLEAKYGGDASPPAGETSEATAATATKQNHAAIQPQNGASIGKSSSQYFGSLKGEAGEAPPSDSAAEHGSVEGKEGTHGGSGQRVNQQWSDRDRLSKFDDGKAELKLDKDSDGKLGLIDDKKSPSAGAGHTFGTNLKEDDEGPSRSARGATNVNEVMKNRMTLGEGGKGIAVPRDGIPSVDAAVLERKIDLVSKTRKL